VVFASLPTQTGEDPVASVTIGESMQNFLPDFSQFLKPAKAGQKIFQVDSKSFRVLRRKRVVPRKAKLSVP